MEDAVRLDESFYIVADAERTTAPLRVLKQGESFAVFDQYGDVLPAEASEQGLYHEGTRHLSRLEVLLWGKRPLLLSSTVSDDNIVFTADLTNPDVLRSPRRASPRCLRRRLSASVPRHRSRRTAHPFAMDAAAQGRRTGPRHICRPTRVTRGHGNRTDRLLRIGACLRNPTTVRAGARAVARSLRVTHRGCMPRRQLEREPEPLDQPLHCRSADDAHRHIDGTVPVRGHPLVQYTLRT